MTTAPRNGERLNWQQACALLGCSKTKFYRLVKAGDIATYKVGKRGLWVRREDCEKLLHASLPTLYATGP